MFTKAVIELKKENMHCHGCASWETSRAHRTTGERFVLSSLRCEYAGVGARAEVYTSSEHSLTHSTSALTVVNLNN